jgi:hypothetical protein
MLRDIHQLQDAPPFGVTAVEGLLTVETMLHDVIRHVPFCENHRAVWSSHLARIILDAASQVDSVWKATAKLLDPGTARRLTLKDHFHKFGDLVANQSVVFFSGESPSVISPFCAWQKSDFSVPPWWSAYNSLKHDRFVNQTEATLGHAVDSVAALLLAIVYSGTCDLALICAMLLDPSSSNPWAFTNTGLLRDVAFDCRAKIETKLLAHPLGVFGVKGCNLSSYWASASPRFNAWWTLNSHRFTASKGLGQE